MKDNHRLAVIPSILAIVLTALVVYRFILFPAQGEALYPWGSDTLGHLLKVEYLAQSLSAGDLYPNIMPEWYMGVMMNNMPDLHGKIAVRPLPLVTAGGKRSGMSGGTSTVITTQIDPDKLEIASCLVLFKES